MNYKKIAKFIKDARNLIIWNDDGEQWISDGIAAYPVLGMPVMSNSEMLMFLGLYDQADKISEAGGICRTFYTTQGAIVLKNKYFDAVEHNADEDLITYQPTSGKNPGIAVFIGFDLAAVIMPLATRGMSEKYLKLANMLQLRDDKTAEL